MAVDPVCGREVHPKQSQWLLSYQREIYHFCSGACARRFMDFPEGFISREEARRPLLFERPESQTKYADDLMRTR